ncbi:DNA replication/repair protein RecF [Roseobacter sp. HKCCA0434]|uniref:DNA replication/repair protein RecF n=1 Tax=Roseobacter sp. HKCCA0434 TaxID=3079297 RepID=UPI002905CD2B|nr:DNA replication/repair protein RecF [Roseobacter sp. HKCCA0434]
MPHVATLRLNQFRSHARSLIETEGRSVAIWGPNGAGKTNILEAVSLLSPGRGLRRATPAELARQPQALGWRVQARIEGARAHDIVTGAEGEASRTVRIDDKAAPQTALARLMGVVWLVPAMDRLWTEGASERRRFLDRMTLSFAPDHAEHVLRYEKAMRERNRLLRDQVRDPGWYAALEEQMARAGAEIIAARLDTVTRLAAAQADAATSFPTATLTLTDPDGAPETADDLATRFADGRGRDLAAGRSLTGPHRADLDAVFAAKGVPARAASTGEQKALLISLVLANARALKAARDAAPVLLLDEVAAHLDADRRTALYAEIAALGAQAWMTGTGPDLFSEVGNHTLNLEVTESNGESHIATH